MATEPEKRWTITRSPFGRSNIIGPDTEAVEVVPASLLEAAESRCKELEEKLRGLVAQAELHCEGAPVVNVTFGPLLTAIDEARTALQRGDTE